MEVYKVRLVVVAGSQSSQLLPVEHAFNWRGERQPTNPPQRKLFLKVHSNISKPDIGGISSGGMNEL